MTDKQRRIEIEKLIAKHTEQNTVSREVARRSLINEGIYTKKGALRVEFGGQRKKEKATA